MGTKKKNLPYLVAVRYGEEDKRYITEIVALGGYKFTGKAIRDAVRCYATYLELKSKVESEFNGNK